MPTFEDYRGRAVRLTEERLAHILEHPEMKGVEAVIVDTLASPLQVLRSLGDPDAHLYYRLYTHASLGEKYLCVVVKVLTNDAFVLTAYLTDRVRRGVQLWPENS